MGNRSSSTKPKILVVGQSTSGKSCLLSRLSCGFDQTHLGYIPTVGLNVASLRGAGELILMQEVSGNMPWVLDLVLAFYLDDKLKAIVFVLDSTCTDKDEITQTRRFIERIRGVKEISSVMVYVVAAKIDSELAVESEKMLEMYNLVDILKDRLWNFAAVSSRTGEGIDRLRSLLTNWRKLSKN